MAQAHQKLFQLKKIDYLWVKIMSCLFFKWTELLLSEHVCLKTVSIKYKIEFILIVITLDISKWETFSSTGLRAEEIPHFFYLLVQIDIASYSLLHIQGFMYMYISLIYFALRRFNIMLEIFFGHKIIMVVFFAFCSQL